MFPPVCPACGSANGRRVIPQSPEVETFRCGSCDHEWSAPAPPPMRPVPDQALPRDWFKGDKKP
jgi:transposase-like protein